MLPLVMVCNSDSFYMHFVMSAEEEYNSVDNESLRSKKLDRIFKAIDYLDHAEKEDIVPLKQIRELRKKYILKASEIVKKNA